MKINLEDDYFFGLTIDCRCLCHEALCPQHFAHCVFAESADKKRYWVNIYCRSIVRDCRRQTLYWLDIKLSQATVTCLSIYFDKWIKSRDHRWQSWLRNVSIAERYPYDSRVGGERTSMVEYYPLFPRISCDKFY